MYAHKGDKLVRHGRIVGHPDQVAEILEVLGQNGQPPYRIKTEDGHESVVYPGPDQVVRTAESPAPPPAEPY